MTDQNWDENPLTVTELIALLQQCPPDAAVDSDGCACEGDATGVKLRNGRVLISRTAHNTAEVVK